MSLKSSIIYFMLGNYYFHKEIGYYVNESISDKYDQSDLNLIISLSKEIFEKINSNNNKIKINSKQKEISKKFIIYYILINSDTFYLSAVTKDFETKFREDEIFDLFRDIENQGIKKLTDKNGELSKIGRQNLKFCIEQNYQRNNKENNSILNFFKSKNNNSEHPCEISLLSTQIFDAQSDGKEGAKKLLKNEEGNIDQKSDKEKINDTNIDYKDDEIILRKKIKCRKISLLVCAILTVVIIITTIILFLFK